MKRLLWNILRAVIGIAIIILLILKVDSSALLGLFGSLRYSYLLLMVVFLAVLYSIEVLNIKNLTNVIGGRISYKNLFKLHMLSYSIGLFIPGKIGQQFSLIYLLSKKGIKLGNASAVVVLDKIITLASLFIISILGFYFLLPDIHNAVRARATFLIILIILAGYFLVINSKGRGLIKKYILRRFSGKFAGFSSTLRNFYKSNIHIVLLNFALTTAKFFISALIIFCFFMSLGFNVNIYYIFVINAMVIIVSFIPLTPNGIGIRESAAVYLFGLVGVSSVAVVGAYLLNIVVNYLTGLFSLILFFNEFNVKRNPDKIGKS